ncbi:MAG: UDP-N-acetylmuramoyl-tripeptide--D-alanyl-D-alanine ligase [Nitrospirae bacterium]|nr:UDP-N-acetylmuramoyl-tripeptide--D-alanyl-D-alanine ligase [Nitrospirota bacterium]
MDEIIKATGGELLAENSKTFSGVSIDSRTIREGEVFFAIRGDRLDGHDFLDKALLKGFGAVVDSGTTAFPKGKVIIHVKDTLKALQDFAHFLRMRLDIPVVAITGSNGKTTTKEMAYSILSKRFKTVKNEGNLNNHIGLPLSLMKLQPDDEAVVLEMGMNAPGEIRRLREIAVPTHGVVTNVGSAHLGRLGSHTAIRDAKLEILPGLSAAVLNADDNLLMQGILEAEDFNGEIITFSVDNDSHVRAKNIRATERGSDFILEFKDVESLEVSLGVHGVFNIYNALAAAAVCFSLGVQPGEIKAALEDFRAFSMRFEVIKRKGMTIINDSYNANPSSMEEALKELIRIGAKGRKIAALGDMGELDEFSEEEHKALVNKVCKMGLDVFAAVGEMMTSAAEECKKPMGGKARPEVYTFRSVEDANEGIPGILKKADTVLIKGSRSMKMDKLAERILNVI